MKPAGSLEGRASEPGTKRHEAFLEFGARIATLVLVCVLLFFALQLGFALQLHRPAVFKVVFAALALLVAASLRIGRPSMRVNAALMLLPLIGGIFAYEAYAAWRRPRRGNAAWLAGRSFDSRGLFETLQDERRKDPSAVSYVIPRALLTHHLVVEHWEPEAVARTVQKDWGIVVDGVRVLPLGGVSNRRTVFGNENGTRVIYESDEHGFNNPHGLWRAGDVQVAILGDSFSQGAAVAATATTAAHIRKRFPRTLNLGMSANGPLMEYAGLKEYVVSLRPPIVLWVYYSNDLSDMEVEKGAPILWRYLEDDDFRQGLASKQAGIDEALEAYLREVEHETPPRWPPRLETYGLTRANTPLWLQDLVTTEDHSSLAAFVRLDGSIWIATKKFLEVNHFAEPPDFDLFERILASARDVVTSWGGRLYFVYLPDIHHLDGRHPDVFSREPVLALVKRLSIPLIDVHQVFVDHPNPESLRVCYDSHANEAGYELHAKTILRALEDGKDKERQGHP